MKVMWITDTFGKVFVNGLWVANAHKDSDGNITLDQASINRVKPSALPTL